ncbi:MAG: hypothetical protein P8N76_07880 [Pirellulaceae bacterium]|nr:hypothetical protein [Pirellulaceae bacterium]
MDRTKRCLFVPSRLCFGTMIWLATAPLLAGQLEVMPKGGEKVVFETLLQQSRRHYQQRKVEVKAALASPTTAGRRQRQLLRDFRRIIGELPQRKNALNARTTGVIECNGYKIEKVVYESRPNHHVTANLYLPTKGKGPFPGVAVACGHSANGKAYESYQKVCTLLALNGFVTLIYDPICQGERHQLVDAPRHGTTTHAMLNAGSLLVGRSIVGYEAWDGIRSIDYLLSRHEVDQEKPIGLTGTSGGGTQTNFLMALDPRVGPAAPSCYVMRKQRKYETIGPADGCQHLPSEVALGIDHIDYYWMRAPKPTLTLAAQQDFFDYESTKDAATEAASLYTVLGQPERTALFSHGGEHGFLEPHREAVVGWMKRWLNDDTKQVREPAMQLQPERSLQVTSTGQVATAFKQADTVAKMNLARARELSDQRRRFWGDRDPADCLAEVARQIGLTQASEEKTIQLKETIDRDKYRIEKLLIRQRNMVPLPGLLFLPNDKSRKCPAVIIVDSVGKTNAAAVGGDNEKLVQAGWVVLALDIAGVGETADQGSKAKYYNSEHRIANLAFHIGRPLLGQRVDQILAAASSLSEFHDFESVHLIGRGKTGPVVLHAAALDRRFASVAVNDSIESWVEDVVAKPLTRDLLGYVVPGALLKYDLPDLIEVIAPRDVILSAEK